MYQTLQLLSTPSHQENLPHQKINEHEEMPNSAVKHLMLASRALSWGSVLQGQPMILFGSSYTATEHGEMEPWY